MGTHDHDDELDGFLEGLRTAFPARPVAAEDEHVAGMIAAAHLLADKGNPVARPASNADAPAPQVSWLPKQRRNRMSDRNWSRTLALKVLAPVVVLFTMLGGVAWAGGLPQPLQKTASHVAGFAGLTLDDGTDATETPDPTETDTQDPTSTNNQDGDNQGENNQDSTPTEDNQGDNNQGDVTTGDNSGDNNQDSTSTDDNQGESTSGDTTSGDNSQGDSTSGDSSGSSDNSGDSSGSGSDGSGSGSSGSDSSGGGSGQD